MPAAISFAKLKQAKRLMRLSFPREDGPDAVLLANELTGIEAVSKDFEFQVMCLSDNPEIALKDVQCKMVCVELLRDDDSKRYFNGYCFEFRLVEFVNSLATYEMRLRPWLAFFKLRQDNYIFHNKTIEEQTKEIFCDSGLSSYDLRTKEPDPKRTFSVQYDESDYNYLHRRWEEMGWHYWYEHTERGHKLILADATPNADPVDGKSTIALHHASGSNKDDKIRNWSPVRQVVSGKVAFSNYDFKTPTPQNLTETSEIEQGDIHKIEVYAYQGLYGYKDAAQGQKIAKRRMEQIKAEGKYFDGDGNNRQMQSGRWFRLTQDHESAMFPGSAQENEFFILNIEHYVSNNLLNNAGGHGSYRNSFRCLRRSIPWRPAEGLNSELIRIPGIDTATVVGPKGEEIHTDEFGRIKIQFHWDREGKNDEQSSCWVRVMTPWADSNFGMISLPRIGTEVVVQYLHGNPDRPIVAGQLYNKRHMPPWDLPANKTQSGVLSRSSKGGSPANANAFRFEDKKGQEEVWLHAEKDQRIEVEHDESHWVGHDRSKTVDHDESVRIHNDRTKCVDHHEKIAIGLTLSRMVGLMRNTVIGLTDMLLVGKARVVSIGQSNTVSVGETETRTIGKTQITQVGEHLELVCGAAKIVLRSDGTIYLQGSKIELKAGEHINADSAQIDLNCGAAKAPPDAPKPSEEPPQIDTGLLGDAGKLVSMASSLGVGGKGGGMLSALFSRLGG